MLPRENCLNLSEQNNCNGNKETTYCHFYLNFNSMFKWQVCYREKKLLQLIINVRKSHRQPLQFETRLRRSRVVRLSCSLRFFILAVEFKMRASSSRQCIPLRFAILPVLATPQNNLKHLGLIFICFYIGNNSDLDTCSYGLLSRNDRYFQL